MKQLYFHRVQQKIITMLLMCCIMIFLVACSSKTSNDITQDEASSDIANSEADNDNETDQDVAVMFINAGKADSILVQVDEKNYLIDTGKDTSVPEIYRALENQGVESIDGVFLTHTHSDHIGGLQGIVEKYQVECVYSATISMNEDDGDNKIDKLVQKLGLKSMKLNAGDTVEITKDISFEVIAPLSYNADDDNDNSLVMKLEVNNKSFLFTGDMQFAEENTLIATGDDLSADILKVGNHGNKDATSEEFVSAVNPHIAIITTDTSVKADSANERVIEALSDSDIYLAQDFQCGVLVTVASDGEILVSDPQVEKSGAFLVMSEVSKETQMLNITNKGEDIDISGYFIYSSKGSEIFVFPENTLLKSGESLSVSAEKGNGDYKFQDKKVWSDDKEDIAYLYDKFGNIISQCESE